MSQNALARNWRTRSAALLTVLAMLIAPLCASTCATQACASSSGSTAVEGDACHRSSVNKGSAQQMGIAPLRMCVSSELPTFALNETKKSPELRDRTAAHVDSGFAPAAHAARLARNASFCFPDKGGSRLRDSAAVSAVLRI